jgi:LysR family transcriptional regulator, transcriptional activator of nhaA
MPLELNYHHLFYFWRCVRAGRITAAAQDLHLSQSALSLQLQSLERALGKRLLSRSRRGVELTIDGRLVYDHCERIFAAGDALAQSLRGSKGEASPLRLGVTAGLGRDAVLAALGALGTHPGSTSIYIGPREDVRERLQSRRLDVAFAAADFSPELGVPFRSSLVDTRALVFVAAPALASRWTAFPPKGEEVPMLLRSRENPMREQVLGWLRERGARPVAVAETEDVDLLRVLALQGLGVTTQPAAAVSKDVSAGRLRVLARPPLAQEVLVNWPDVGVESPVRRLLGNLPALRARLRSERAPRAA